jgi:CheY-like chemotaxis protein
MAEFVTDVVTPAQLTAAVQAAMTGGLPFEGIIPSRPTDNIKQAISRVDLRVSAEVARYRAWETVPDIGRRPGFSIEEYEIAPLGWSYRLNEEDLERFNRLQQGIGERLDSTVVDAIFNDALRAANAVLNRLTLTHGELLSTGRVTLTELGNPVTANAIPVVFPVPANQLNVAPATLWSNTGTSTPVTDLAAWEAIYRANNDGRNPDAWGISSEILANLVLNTQIRTLAPVTGIVPGVITAATVGQVLSAAGVAAPLVVTNDVERPRLDGSGNARVIGNRKVIGLQAGMAQTYFAPPPVLAVMGSAGNARLLRSEAQGVIAYSTTGIRPPEVITTAEAVALPLLERPSALFIANV